MALRTECRSIGLLISQRYHDLFQADLQQLRSQLAERDTNLTFVLLPGSLLLDFVQS